MVNVLIVLLYLLGLVASLPAVFAIGYFGYKPEKFKNWRLARTCTVVMIGMFTGMMFALRTFETIPDGWDAFVLFSAIMFTVPLSMYFEAWTNHTVSHVQYSPSTRLENPHPVNH